MSRVDVLVWTVAHQGRSATVSEGGVVRGDADLVRLLEARLSEPVTVFARGTVRDSGAGTTREITLHPGDGRYVVARMRTLCETETAFVITGCDWH